MILVTGKGTSGSWQIRGEQLGRAIGADVVPNAEDVTGYDLAIVVKRVPIGLQARLARAGVPLVWDVVDAWPQPVGNDWGRDECIAWLRLEVRRLRPAGIVAATQAMAADCAEFGVPVLALPHHVWPGHVPRGISTEVATVGYQGGERYLGRWLPFLQQECARRKWRFVVNPASVADLDIVVAVREAGGYAPRNWKSNVKLANAQGCGRPFIGNREAGYLETASGRELWADTEAEMVAALDALTPQIARVAAAARLEEKAPRLEAIAAQYLAWLRSLHA